MRLTESQQIEAIKRLAAEVPATTYDESWIGTGNPSLAFLICLAMGPWKEQRRFSIARAVVAEALPLGGYLYFDLALAHPGMFSYPLVWQQKIVNHIVEELRAIHGLRFWNCLDRWWTMLSCETEYDDHWESVALEFFDMCGVAQKGTKTLWLFLRDVLGIPAFPVDRRVRRVLRAYGLPADSWAITRLCERAGVSTNNLTRACFVYGEHVHAG
jgi:hypothetical protein